MQHNILDNITIASHSDHVGIRTSHLQMTSVRHWNNMYMELTTHTDNTCTSDKQLTQTTPVYGTTYSHRQHLYMEITNHT